MTGSRKPERRRLRAAGRLTNITLAVLLAVGTIIASVIGTGATPALGALLNPGTGVWTDAAAARPPTDATMTIPGINSTTTVSFDNNGVAHIRAGSDADMFRAIGFVHGWFRIFQMDLLRRQASGTLAEVLGPQALASDEFELNVGLVRAAQRDWNAMPANSPARAALVEYSAGVNAAIATLRAAHELPMYFKMLGYAPQPWTPMDSLLTQLLMTQTLNLDISQLSFSYIEKAVGEATFNNWFPVVPRNQQYPYDPGPYQKLPLQPLPLTDPAAPDPQPASAQPAALSAHRNAGATTPSTTTASTTTASTTTASTTTPSTTTPSAAAAVAAAVIQRVTTLPSNAVHTFGNSNVWVVSGSKTASGKPILASDPHLLLTLPSVWYQLSATSPSYDMTGVTLPGIPVVLVGKNQRISWGIANSQHPSTFFYIEKTDASHPGQYYWKGAWRPMTDVRYTIKVKGHSPVEYTVRITRHGPIITQHDVTASMWWAGTLPSDDLDSALKLVRATNFTQFHEALSGWHTPSENFAYADDAGNIGIVNAGYAPQVASGSPDLPMSGTGASDVTGTIPFAALPITYDPKSGFAAASNQREVTAAYPYYYGRGFDFFDQGWRQAEIVSTLKNATGLTIADTEKLQLSEVDPVASQLLPTVIAALERSRLTGTDATALNLLKKWDDSLSPGSAAASIWAKFLTIYQYDVFHANWEHYRIPAVPGDPTMAPSKTGGGLAMDTLLGTLVEWSVTNPDNALFHPPGTPQHTADDLMRSAFSETVSDLASADGPDPAKWQYGKSHFLIIASLLQNSTLDDGPYASGSNPDAIDAIQGTFTRNGKTLNNVSDGGPSWRFITDLGTGQAVSSYPGGASENPASPWYDNGVTGWLAGRYQPVLEGPAATAATKGRTWILAS